MNRSLTTAQINDIFAAAEHVDVPAEQLVAAAAEIRATLLTASADAAWLLTLPAVADDAPVRRIDPMRRARTVRVALVAAALSLALMLSAAVAGALPDPIQGPISRVAEFFGLDLPAADPAPAATTSIGDHPSNSQANDTATGASTGAPRPESNGAASNPAGTGASSPTSTPVATATAPAATPDSTPAPVETMPDKPGNGIGNGYGIGNGNGPPEDPGNGNGPPEDPGNGNGCNGNGNCYGHYK
jgi:hypothetical protein